MSNSHYDVLIIGAGIAGCALAHALSTIPRSKPFRIALLERSLSEPDRIVGELLQPGGVLALRKLGIEFCVDGIDAIPVHGYCVVESGRSVQIPYPGTHEGRSFHHGRFIMKLREVAGRARGVDIIEASATELMERERRVIGVRATRKTNVSLGEPSSNGFGDITSSDTVKVEFFADLVVAADGCFSNFRTAVMGSAMAKSTTKSHFVGAVLEDARLPIPQHGTVALIKGYGPVLLYQIGEHDTRMLVDVKMPLPSDLQAHILTNIVPQLPTALHLPVQTALSKDRLRRMPNSFLPAVSQGSTSNSGSKAGVFLLGDAWNMRHPLTGGGMTVALNDVVMLRDLLGELPEGGLRDWENVRAVLAKWHWKRKPLASTINILSVALYDLFGADDEELEVLRTGCFKYFECGGECINGPVSLLSGIAPSPLLLAGHFFAVAFYAIWVMFTHPYPVPTHNNGHANPTNTGHDNKPIYATPTIRQYPRLFLKSIRVFWTACIVFGPLLWSEIRWWAPSDTARRNEVIKGAAAVGVPVVLAVGCAMMWAGGWRVGLDL